MINKINYYFRIISKWRYYSIEKTAERPFSEYSQDDLAQEGYHSQFGQDKLLVEKIFPGKANGTFVDIGAYDGITFSNTFSLEKSGWRGMAIEPNPVVYEKLKQNRSCMALRGCIGSEKKTALFRAVSGRAEMLSGLVGEYDRKHKMRIENEIRQYGGSYEDIQIECFVLNEILAKHNFQRVDYMNIDVEGAELSILKSIDFNTNQISVISVENNYLDWRIPRFLQRKGYSLKYIAGDEFYILNA